MIDKNESEININDYIKIKNNNEYRICRIDNKFKCQEIDTDGNNLITIGVEINLENYKSEELEIISFEQAEYELGKFI